VPIVADASVAIRGDMSGFNADLNRAETNTKGFAGRIKNILSPRNVIGAAGLFGVGLGVRSLVDFAADAAGAYAELEQTVKTIDDVFADSADTIHEWGETAAETAGMSQQTFMSSAAIMGQTLQNMGFTIEESAERTVQLLDRAADMALAFGKRPQDALLAITAAMRGERDTIEKFGVAIKQVDVNAKIAALGLDTSTAAAKKYAEAAAVVELVLEQSADQAGRFAESQGDIAVEMAKVNAKWSDFVALEVGSTVASIQKGALTVLDGFLGFVDTASQNISEFSLFFGDQRSKIMQTAEDIGMSFNDLRDRVASIMGTGVTFEVALELAADPSGIRAAALDMVMGVGDTIAANAETWVGPAARGVGDIIAQGIAEATPEVEAEAELVARIPEAEMVAQYQAIRASGYQSQVELAKGLIDAQNEVQVAIDAATQIMEDELTANEEIMYLKGEIQTMEMARGVAAEEGKTATVIAMDAAIQAALDRIAFLESDFYQSGRNIGVAWANGLRSAADWAGLMAWEVAAAANPALHGLSPPKEGPLKDIDKGGYNVGLAWAEGLASASGAAQAASWSLAGAFAPSPLGASAMGVSAMPMGGNTYVLHVNGVQYEVAGFDEMAEKLMELGVLNGDGRLA
jgi:hypothetical protein